MSRYRFVVEFTLSQRMALLDILATEMRTVATEFIDCSTSPATVTTSFDLLKLVMDAPCLDVSK